ncbi:MAG: glycosyltransferase family 4 protein [Burkholderiales bacterium]
MRPLHIKHVNFAKGFRGGERQTLNLIEGLAALGVQQTLVCRPNSELCNRAGQAGIPLRQVRQPLGGHLSAQRAHIVHVHEARGAYWAMIEHLLRGTPYLVTRRIPNPVSGNPINNFAYKRAAELIGVSRDVAARLEEQTGRHVHTILDSCTVHIADPVRTAVIKAELGCGPIIGHVGALFDHHKGQSILIAAFQLLANAYPDARLVLLGEGPDKGEFQRLARNDPRIVFAGFQEDVGSWIAAMDVFAFPSREEGLGSSVLDAMLLGVPVASSTAGGLPELIGAQQRGLTVSGNDPQLWADAIRRLLEDAPLRDRLRNAALKFAQEHDIAAMTRHYLDLYESVIRRA